MAETDYTIVRQQLRALLEEHPFDVVVGLVNAENQAKIADQEMSGLPELTSLPATFPAVLRTWLLNGSSVKDPRTVVRLADAAVTSDDFRTFVKAVFQLYKYYRRSV